jgi:hypothetical protein
MLPLGELGQHHIHITSAALAPDGVVNAAFVPQRRSVGARRMSHEATLA